MVCNYDFSGVIVQTNYMVNIIASKYMSKVNVHTKTAQKTCSTLTHARPVLSSYTNQPIDLDCNGVKEL